VDRGTGLGDSPGPLAERYDAGLYDLDGVLYLGLEPIPHAAEAVAAARAAGLRPAFVTNNASRRPAVVAEHLAQLGIPADPADVVTSGQAATRVLREHLEPGATVLVVGADALVEEVELGGFHAVDEATDDVAAVVQGYTPDTGWRELAEATVALRAGALWVATNTDSTLPSPRGPLPGNGAFVAALRTATGLEPLVAGKPQPALHVESVDRIQAQHPLVIGDRLDTDVLGAVAGGADSLLVLTGVAAAHDALAAANGSRPTYIAPDLRGLFQPHPPVRLGEGSAHCADAVATLNGGTLTVRGDGIEALRAACALAWACADAGESFHDVSGLA
jgi:HAD superfamily hydrolase (TIGR01450 family)